jgi:hypothetical protein
MKSIKIPRQRRHTLYFLRELKSFSPVFLDTEIDTSALGAHRAASRARGHRFSLVAYVLYVTGRVLARHPDANAALRGQRRLRMARYPSVDGKLTMDKVMDGQRVVLSAVLAGVDTLSLEDIQRWIDRYRDGDPATMPEFAAVRMLHRLPAPLSSVIYRLGVRPLSRRTAAFGTFAVTSLGHRPVDAFHSVGGTTITLGVGRVMDRPVVSRGLVTIAPVMRLSLTFDHRVIDGAEAADILSEVKRGLEDLTLDDDGRRGELAAPPESNLSAATSPGNAATSHGNADGWMPE